MDHDRPLAGLRVVDVAAGPLSAIGRILAELGADVVRVEPPGGGDDRRSGPAAKGVSLAFVAGNRGKRAVVGSKEQAEKLCEAADVLIYSGDPWSLAGYPLDVEGLRQRNPALTVLSVRPFGSEACADWTCTDAVIHALSSQLSYSGLPDRPPLLPPGELALQCAAVQAVYVVLLAYLARLQTGAGDELDFSVLDAAVQTLDPPFGIVGSVTRAGSPDAVPRGRPEFERVYPIYRCKDGYARVCVLAPRQWRSMFEWLGQPAAFAAPEYEDLLLRVYSDELFEHMSAFFAERTREQIETEAENHRVPAAGLKTLDEVLTTQHFVQRGVFARESIGGGLEVVLPDGVMEIDGARARAARPAPLAYDDVETIASDWRASRIPPKIDFGTVGRPFDGLRVLDLGVIVVGAEQGRLLADYGADVIKVENDEFPDGLRGGLNAVTWSFASGHRNKRGLGVNLREPRGRRILLDLVAKADVLFSNFKPGTLDSLGLGNDVLLSVNPRLVLVDSSAFGSWGPYSGRLGYGPVVRTAAGVTSLWCYTGDPNGFSDAATIYPDHVAARFGAIGALALLVRRGRTGLGGSVSLSQAEVALSQFATEIATLSVAPRISNQHDATAPTRVFACCGDDEWCVIDPRTDAQWAALWSAIGRAEMNSDPTLGSAQGRLANAPRVEHAIASWTHRRTPAEVARVLQSNGVPAAPMLRPADMQNFDHFRQRSFFAELDQPGLPSPITVDNAPIRSQSLADPPLRPAPLRGQHTRVIVSELLSLSPEEIDHLLETKVLTDEDSEA